MTFHHLPDYPLHPQPSKSFGGMKLQTFAFMPKSAFDTASLIRIGTVTAELERLHLWGTDDDIDREFNTVCQTIWGYTLDDFDDDCLIKADP